MHTTLVLIVLWISDFDIKIVTPHDGGVRTLRGHEGAIRSIVFDPDGDLMVRRHYDDVTTTSMMTSLSPL